MGDAPDWVSLWRNAGTSPPTTQVDEKEGSMIAWIQAFLLGLVQAIPILAKYFPPKTAEDQAEENEADIKARLEKEKQTGRPS